MGVILILGWGWGMRNAGGNDNCGIAGGEDCQATIIQPFYPWGTQTALHQEPYATNMSRNGSSSVCFLYIHHVGRVGWRLRGWCLVKLPPKKNVCLHSFQFWNSEAALQQKRPAGKKNDQQICGHAWCFGFNFPKSDFLHIPRLKGCVLVTETLGETLTKHVAKELDLTTMQRDPV